MKVPFSAYDFFGYLASGFLVLAAVDFASTGGWILTEDRGWIYGVLWTEIAYVVGHIVAQFAQALLEDKLVRQTLRPPEDTLFGQQSCTRWRYIFPGYYRPLPELTRSRILRKAKAWVGLDTPGRALFLHCHAIAKRDQVTLERLNIFLQLYGFCRNMSAASVVTAFILMIGAGVRWDNGGQESKLYWAVAALIAGGGLLYRYLKFYRLYTHEVFITYAETASDKGAIEHG